MKQLLICDRIPTKRLFWFIFQSIFLFVLPLLAYAAGDNQPSLIRGDLGPYNIQVAGSLINAESDYTFTVRSGHLIMNRISARYKCRTYQGGVHAGFIEIKDGSDIIARKSFDNGMASAGPSSQLHEWTEVPIAKLSTISNKCRNQTYSQSLDIPVRLWNTCGRDEGHTRNGGGRIKLNLQCSPSTIPAAVNPILWRYECSGPNMFIEGTSKKSIEKTNNNSRVMCVYRAPEPKIKRK